MAGILQYVLWLVLVPAISGAQDNTSTQSVDVGDNGFTYDPDTLTVSPGGEVEFHFYPGNHSVVQAAFSKPCSPMNDGSVFSGFVAPESGESDMVFTLIVNDTDPIWFYCAQVGHCQAGMVGVINPPKNDRDTLDVFKAAAARAESGIVPVGVKGGILGTPSSTSTGASSTSTETSSESPSSASTTSTSTSSTSTSSPTSSEAETLHSLTGVSIILALYVTVAMIM